MNEPPDPCFALFSSPPQTFASPLFWTINPSSSAYFSRIVAKSCCFSSFPSFSCCKSSVLLDSFKKVEHPQSGHGCLYCRAASEGFDPSELWRSTLNDGKHGELFKIWVTWSQDSIFCFIQGVLIKYEFRSRNLDCRSVSLSHYGSIWLHRRYDYYHFVLPLCLCPYPLILIRLAWFFDVPCPISLSYSSQWLSDRKLKADLGCSISFLCSMCVIWLSRVPRYNSALNCYNLLAHVFYYHGKRIFFCLWVTWKIHEFVSLGWEAFLEVSGGFHCRMIDVIDLCLCVLILRWGYCHIMWDSRKLYLFCNLIMNFNRRCFSEVDLIAYCTNWPHSPELELELELYMFCHGTCNGPNWKNAWTSPSVLPSNVCLRSNYAREGHCPSKAFKLNALRPRKFKCTNYVVLSFGECTQSNIYVLMSVVSIETLYDLLRDAVGVTTTSQAPDNRQDSSSIPRNKLAQLGNGICAIQSIRARELFAEIHFPCISTTFVQTASGPRQLDVHILLCFLFGMTPFCVEISLRLRCFDEGVDGIMSECCTIIIVAPF